MLSITVFSAAPLFIAGGLYAAVRGFGGHQADIVMLAAGAAIPALTQGLADWSVLTSSQPPHPPTASDSHIVEGTVAVSRRSASGHTSADTKGKSA